MDSDWFAYTWNTFTQVESLQKIAAACGLEYYTQNNQISHSMSTILLGPDGAVVKSWPGNDWRTPEVSTAVEQATTVTRALQDRRQHRRQDRMVSETTRATTSVTMKCGNVPGEDK